MKKWKRLKESLNIWIEQSKPLSVHRKSLPWAIYRSCTQDEHYDNFQEKSYVTDKRTSILHTFLVLPANFCGVHWQTQPNHQTLAVPNQKIRITAWFLQLVMRLSLERGRTCNHAHSPIYCIYKKDYYSKVSFYSELKSKPAFASTKQRFIWFLFLFQISKKYK